VTALLLALSGCEREEKAVREDLPLARTTQARSDVQAIAAAVKHVSRHVRRAARVARIARHPVERQRRAVRAGARLDPGAARRLVGLRLHAAG
jgi:hypothetical protein